MTIGTVTRLEANVRVPPHDLEAEESVLGSMLLSRTACSEILELITEGEEFYAPKHGKIFDAIRDLVGRGDPVDFVTIVDELRRRSQIDEVGGPAYVSTLISSTPTAANGAHYARIVSDHATLRDLIDAGTDIAREAYDVPGEIEDALGRAEQRIFQISNRRLSGDLDSIQVLLEEAVQRIESLAATGNEITGLATGFHDLDRLLAGLQPGNLILIAARPAMGKSTLAMNMAQHVAAVERKGAVIFSLEMSKHEIVQRMICAEARTDMKSVRRGQMSDADWRRIIDAMGKLHEAPLYIDDSPTITMSEIRAKCRRLHTKGDLSLVVVDYLQLMHSPRRVENRVQEVAEISRGLKILAKELDIPVIAVSQLSRQLEQGSAKPRKPRLADLRESGALEQDADVVMFINREDYYDEESERKGEADIHVEKHRNGPTDTVTLAFLKQFTKFENLARS
jgi:replicative DNA helicase